ncbi:MAG: DoxX family membrane protein [Anaerolineales bacterium]|nr:DoxX family membrane protein [Anaerolineales bacterium]
MFTSFQTTFNRVDEKITNFLAEYGVIFLRISLGLVFFWFGFLKFFPGISPAQDLATRTIEVLTFGIITPDISIYILAVWETLIGLGLIFGVFLRATLLLLLVQMLGTITPLFLFPGEAFVIAPFVPTLEGQYIIKNLVLISAGMVIGATVRGGEMLADPEAVERGKESRSSEGEIST